ncbi:MAG: cytosine deaminase [Alphaproteobacteria bacterium]
MAGFLAVPSAGAYWLTDARVPAVLVDGAPAGSTADREGLLHLDLRIEAGRVAALLPAGTAPAGAPHADLDGGQVWPGFVDIHTHIDKGHIWPRRENPDGTFLGARDAVMADRRESWSAEDVERRMDFSLRCAWAHGTRALRTHIDSIPPQHATSWPVLARIRDAWAGRIDIQATSLIHLPLFADADKAAELADTVAAHGGVFGAVAYIEDDAPALLDRVFALAAERGLDIDFHVDEGLDLGARSLKMIAEAALRAKFKGTVLCGHCCSLSIQDDDFIEATLDRVAEANLAVVSLPMCNMYLQDRVPGRTPRRRGVTLLHEMAARGIRVSVASDNTRDPFYAYGDLDPLEVFREAARIAHLDRPFGDWPAVVARTPADVMGLAGTGRIAIGGLADLVLFRARGWTELLSRPQTDRVVLRAGRAQEATPPDYRELDDLFGEEEAARAADRRSA